MKYLRMGYLREVDDGGWYFIPSNLVDDFDQMYKSIQVPNSLDELENIIIDFERIFGGFRLQHDITDIKFRME